MLVDKFRHIYCFGTAVLGKRLLETSTCNHVNTLEVIYVVLLIQIIETNITWSHVSHCCTGAAMPKLKRFAWVPDWCHPSSLLMSGIIKKHVPVYGFMIAEKRYF